MASQGEVLHAEGEFKAVYSLEGQQHVVEPLRTAAQAALVLDMLTVHQCLAAGLPLDASCLRSDARLAQLARMAGAASLHLSLGSAAVEGCHSIALPELVQQLNVCAVAAATKQGALVL
jgi:hypothetical protein